MRRKTLDPGRPMRILAGLALATLGWTVAAAQSDPSRATPILPSAAERESLIATGDSPDLFLMYTGDVIGYLDPCG